MRACRALLAALALMLTSVAHPASGAEPATFEHRAYEFVRTIDTQTRLQIDFTNGTAGEISSALVLWGLDDAGRVSAFGLLRGPGGYFAPESNATGSPIGCVTLPVKPATVCESRLGGSVNGSIGVETKKRSDTRRLIVALVGDTRLMEIHLARETRGWTMRRLPGRVHVLRTQDLSNPYVISTGESVEHFTSAQVTTQAKSSVAFAGLPCRGTPAGATGFGTASLAGGGERLSLGCPGGPITGFAVAKGTTKWSLSGDVWGSTNSGEQVTSQIDAATLSPGDFRLIVVDGPF